MATIKSCSTGGVNVSINGGYWRWFPCYDSACETCNELGYRVLG